MSTAHHILPIKRSSYRKIERMVQDKSFIIKRDLRLQHDRPSGLLYTGENLYLQGLGDEFIDINGMIIAAEMHRLPAAEYHAYIKQSPTVIQFKNLEILSQKLRMPTITSEEAIRLVEEIVKTPLQNITQSQLIQPETLFAATWLQNRCVLQRNGADWYLVVFFDLRPLQPEAFARQIEIGLDWGAKPLVYGYTSEDKKLCTQEVGSKLLNEIRPRLSYDARRLIDRMEFAWHQEQFQRVSDFLCRNARYVYAENLEYKNMDKNFLQRARRIGLIDFQECWLHTRLQSAGVRHEKINPAFTSSRCSHCSGHPLGNRQGDLFSCHTCGWTGNAHHNAARNILRRGRTKAEHYGTIS